MGSMDGVALAKAVRKAGGTMQIVFVTGYSDYIAEGYDVEALNYLMKPVDAAKLFDVLDKAVVRMRRDSRCLDLQCAEGLMRIPLADIRYLDVRRNYVTVHADRDYTVKRPLGEFEAELGDGFCRVGRAMIVNLRRIRCVGRSSVQLTDGTTLPLPRGAYEPLNRTIIDQTRLRMAGSRPAGCRKAVPGWTGQNAKEGHDVVSWARQGRQGHRGISARAGRHALPRGREHVPSDAHGRHDYRNHLQTMKALDTPIKSGNAMADVILSSKMSLAQAHGIDVRVDAHIPIKLRISELDLCCVLGNLFDNAIEANDGLPEADRMIRVYMGMKGTQLYISFTNASSGGKQRKVGGRFRTTKSDEGHGFGLVHIDQIIEAAGGYLSRNFEDGAFTTEILLPQS